VIGRAREWWLTRAPRERVVYGAGAATLLVASLWAYVWLPVQSDRARLAVAVPKLQAQALETAREAAEVERLRAAARAPRAAPQSAIDDAMKAAGFGDAYAGLAPLGEGRVQVNLRAVPFDELVRTLATLGERNGVAVESAALRAAGEGKVRVESLVLRSAPGG
jgi:type II secretory pathway component PulM